MEIKPLARGGMKLTIPDDESDSLVIIEIARNNGLLMVKTGLRGNFDAKDRPIRYTYATLDAPDVDARTRSARKQNALANLAPVRSREVYADVRFPDQGRDWTYRVPPSLLVNAGDFVEVGAGLFANWVGRVTRTHSTHPPCHYVLDVTRKVV